MDIVFDDFMKLKPEVCEGVVSKLVHDRIAKLALEVEKNGKDNIIVDETICKSFYFLKYIY